MFESGDTIYYKRPEDVRAMRGEIISYADGCYTVKAMRTATCSRRPVLTITENQVFAVAEIGRNKPVKYHREYNSGGGLSVPAQESLQRKVSMQDRLKMNEMQVFTAPAMIALQKRVVRSLARKNHIPAHSQDFSELESEFICATLNAVRTICSKATDKELSEFKAFLSGSVDTAVFFCRVVLNIARTGKTGCIRHLQRRNKYYLSHVNLESLERRLSA
jgi:hypothetical protein